MGSKGATVLGSLFHSEVFRLPRRLRGFMACAVCAVALLANMPTIAAEPLPTLSEDWPWLEPVYADPSNLDFSYTVDVGGDAPLATHVMARTAAGSYLQRDRNGYWSPWSGGLESLLDNGFQARDGKLTFKVVQEDLSAEWLPIAITVAYRTATALKLGVFELRGQSAGAQ